MASETESEATKTESIASNDVKQPKKPKMIDDSHPLWERMRNAAFNYINTMVSLIKPSAIDPDFADACQKLTYIDKMTFFSTYMYATAQICAEALGILETSARAREIIKREPQQIHPIMRALGRLAQISKQIDYANGAVVGVYPSQMKQLLNEVHYGLFTGSGTIRCIEMNGKGREVTEEKKKIPDSAFQLLKMLVERDENEQGLLQSDLKDLMTYNERTIRQQVSFLLEEGCIDRDRESRTFRLSLTDKGKLTYDNGGHL